MLTVYQISLISVLTQVMANTAAYNIILRARSFAKIKEGKIMITKTISAGVVLFASFVAGSAFAQDPDLGESLYMQYCATCHGSNAKGGGPLTQLLTVEVPALTQLAANNDGEYPMLKVVHIIDGRTGLRGHGGTMPTYGDIFMAETEGPIRDLSNILETRGRIMSLALYLESIQE